MCKNMASFLHLVGGNSRARDNVSCLPCTLDTFFFLVNRKYTHRVTKLRIVFLAVCYHTGQRLFACDPVPDVV